MLLTRLHTLKYTDLSFICMAHKTITISEDAYNSLNKLKKGNESFTEIILRLTSNENKRKNLLLWIKNKKANEELANSLSFIYNERNSVELRNF